jgi:hypothetical protein
MRYEAVAFATVGRNPKRGRKELIPYSILKYWNSLNAVTVDDWAYVDKTFVTKKDS